jgi:hypothetical protein
VSFSQQVSLYEEESRNLDSQRPLPGWNYFSYFVVKENLALAYELMGIYDDSLVQYDELDAQYFQSLSEHSDASWFSDFGARDLNDDSNDILDLSHKKYRDMIQFVYY